MTDDELVRFFRRLADEGGTAAVEADEARAVLDLARVVAHEHERRFAPVASYAAGLAIGMGTDPSERAKRLRALVAVVRGLGEER